MSHGLQHLSNEEVNTARDMHGHIKEVMAGTTAMRHPGAPRFRGRPYTTNEAEDAFAKRARRNIFWRSVAYATAGISLPWLIAMRRAGGYEIFFRDKFNAKTFYRTSTFWSGVALGLSGCWLAQAVSLPVWAVEAIKLENSPLAKEARYFLYIHNPDHKLLPKNGEDWPFLEQNAGNMTRNAAYMAQHPSASAYGDMNQAQYAGANQGFLQPSPEEIAKKRERFYRNRGQMGNPDAYHDGLEDGGTEEQGGGMHPGTMSHSHHQSQQQQPYSSYSGQIKRAPQNPHQNRNRQNAMDGWDVDTSGFDAAGKDSDFDMSYMFESGVQEVQNAVDQYAAPPQRGQGRYQPSY